VYDEKHFKLAEYLNIELRIDSWRKQGSSRSRVELRGSLPLRALASSPSPIAARPVGGGERASAARRCAGNPRRGAPRPADALFRRNRPRLRFSPLPRCGRGAGVCCGRCCGDGLCFCLEERCLAMKYATSPSSVLLQNQNAGEGLGRSLPCTLRWSESSVGTCKASTGSRLERAMSLMGWWSSNVLPR
jgi:hypothetical protein